MKEQRSQIAAGAACLVAVAALVVAVLSATVFDDRGRAQPVAAPSAAASPLATSAVTSTARSQREAVVFIANLEQGGAAQRAFYRFVRFSAVAIANGALLPAYNRVTMVEGSAATLSRLRDTLSAATARPGITAVDLIFVTHGLNQTVFFSDGSKSMADVRSTIQAALTASQRARLRMVFSTACYGASHRAEWLNLGFDVASGGNRIYADSATSYPSFLVTWAAGANFGAAIAAANAADPLRVSDNAAKPLLQSWGFPSPPTVPNWADVDSTRLTSGNSALTINS